MELLTSKEVTAMLGLGEHALKSFRERAIDFPRPVRLTARVLRWHKEEVEEWINTRDRVSLNERTNTENEDPDK